MVLLQVFKFLNLIKFRAYNTDEAKKWFPITLFLVAMIYTGSKALQFLPIPVYTIFKNLTIILIAYGEVLWFGGSITGMMMTSFSLMVYVYMMTFTSLLIHIIIDTIISHCWLE